MHMVPSDPAGAHQGTHDVGVGAGLQRRHASQALPPEWPDMPWNEDNTNTNDSHYDNMAWPCASCLPMNFPPDPGRFNASITAPLDGQDPARPADEGSAMVACIPSERLFGGACEVHIRHKGALYRLRQTSLGKLILTK